MTDRQAQLKAVRLVLRADLAAVRSRTEVYTRE